jgi:hypothetical protein
MRNRTNTVWTVAVVALLAGLIPAVATVSRAQQPAGEAPQPSSQVTRLLTRAGYSWRARKAQVDLDVLKTQLEAKKAELLALQAQVETKQAELLAIVAEQQLSDLAPTQAILAALAKPIPMRFPHETPLEDVLKYIKSATAGPDDTGIPIYVDPVGLHEARKTMTSPVTLDLEGVPLGTTLKFVLKQLGLAYEVKDGLLSITSDPTIREESGVLNAR